MIPARIYNHRMIQREVYILPNLMDHITFGSASRWVLPTRAMIFIDAKFGRSPSYLSTYCLLSIDSIDTESPICMAADRGLGVGRMVYCSRFRLSP